MAIGLSRPIGRRNERRNFSARPGGRLVHLCVPDSGIARATLALRDYLRDPPAERDAYAIEKRRLASLHVGDTADRREAYASAKSPFLGPLNARALQLGYPRTAKADRKAL